MKAFTENNWAGWDPSASEKSIGKRNVLLRADNLTMEEKGIARIARAAKKEATGVAGASFGDIYGIYSTTLPHSGPLGTPYKTRYLYTGTEIFRSSFSPGVIDTSVVAGLSGTRAAFNSILNHVFICSGTKRYKDRGDVTFPLGIAALSPPTATAITTVTKDLNNLNAGTYANWAIVAGMGAVTANATDVTFTPDATSLRASIRTTFAGTLDFTDLNGTGNNTPEDIFSFFFKVDDLQKIDAVDIYLYNEDPATTSATNYFYKQWNFSGSLATKPNYEGFPLAQNLPTLVELRRGDAINVGNEDLTNEWIHVGVDSTKNWTNIKTIEVFVQCLDSTTVLHFNGFTVKGGAQATLNGEYNYVIEQSRNATSYVERSLKSTPLTISNLSGGVATINPPGAVNAQANIYRIYRQDPGTGVYLMVNEQTGALGFTPAAFVDYVKTSTLETNAAADPGRILEYYRTALPDNIIDMIWFRDRMIYLTAEGFFPSYQLDPGSYDSRFSYEVGGTGGNSETCLFAMKLDVGTFIIATTRDFYRVTGTFGLLSDPGTGVQTLDVNIYPLGISNPPISRAFCEHEGGIVYLSSTGIRILNNATSTLLNGNLDPLFRGEVKYGLTPFSNRPADDNPIAFASKGNQIYCSLTHRDSINRLYILDTSAEGSGWRLWTLGDVPLSNPTVMIREEDGTLLFGSYTGKANFLRSVETEYNYLPVKLMTQFNYGDNPLARKDVLSLKLGINTGGNPASLKISGIGFDGETSHTMLSILSTEDAEIELDISDQLDPSAGMKIEIGCYTNYFALNYFTFVYEERPVPTRRVIQYASNFGEACRKRVGNWPFVADLMGATATVTVRADNVDQLVGTFTDIDIKKTFRWDAAPAATALAYDWEMEINFDIPAEFFGFLDPTIIEKRPVPTNRVIALPSNFGKLGRKRMGTWGFMACPIGETLSAVVTADNTPFTTQTFTSPGDIVKTFFWNIDDDDDVLANDWGIEITAPGVFEFMGFLEPDFNEVVPVNSFQELQPSSNYGTAGRKAIANLPCFVNPRGNDFTIYVTVDGIAQTPYEYTGTTDRPQTIDLQPVDGLTGVDWQRRIASPSGMEFYNWMDPIVAEAFPVRVKYAIQPFTNFGKAFPKQLANWPLVINTLGGTVRLRVATNGHYMTNLDIVNNAIETITWRNNNPDVYGIDWQMILSSDTEFEFYRFMPPEIRATYPTGKLLDKLGPLNFETEGIIYELRIRMLATGTTVHVNVFDQGTSIFEDDIATEANLDEVYLVKFPNSLAVTLLTVDLTSDDLFYRFSAEVKARQTGRETEHRFIPLKDAI